MADLKVLKGDFVWDIASEEIYFVDICSGCRELVLVRWISGLMNAEAYLCTDCQTAAK